MVSEYDDSDWTQNDPKHDSPFKRFNCLDPIDVLQTCAYSKVQQPNCFTYVFFKKMGHPRPHFHLFLSFQTTLQLLQQINVKNVHPVYNAGIQTHDL